MRILILLLLPIFLSAQKEDYQWLFGYEAYNQVEGFGTTVFNFYADSLEVNQSYTEMNFSLTNASICDKNGELLFYTNGIYIANSFHDPMPNGTGLNPIAATERYEEYGLRIAQGAIIFPQPDNDSLYYLFHVPLDEPDFDINLAYHSPYLYYTVVNPYNNGGIGRVVEKNIELKQDTFDLDHLTGVRHANGRDWWITISRYASNTYNKFLLSPKGITEYPEQTLGNKSLGGIGQAVFSPDGSKYVRYEIRYASNGGHISIYDFDRCSGLLSNNQRIVLQDTLHFGGAAISPNSRYLYISTNDYVFQFDLEASDIASTIDTVAVYDGFYTTHPILTTRFLYGRLAPDGKIYINSPGSKDYMHVIHHPDSAGIACNVEQHDIKLPTYNSSSLPNFPNYRLGKLEGSPCDTISPVSTTSINLENRAKITTYPNPVQHQLTVDLTLADYTNLNQFQLELTNLYGQVIEQRVLRAYAPIYRFEVGYLARGVYFINLYQQGELVISKKVVLQ